MPDTADTSTTTTSGTTTTAAEKTASARSDINQGWLAELTDAESLVNAARKTEYAAKLADGDIDAAKVEALDNAIQTARKLAGQAVQNTSGKHVITGDEDKLKQELIRQIQLVQKRARQKYDATAPGKLADYAIRPNYKFYSSRSLLEQTASNILLKLNGDPDATPPVAADVLPGIKAAHIAALQQALTAYQAVQGDQADAQSDATTARKQLEALMAEILAKRREIQFAADAEWPHEDPAQAGIRAEFQLPADRVMK